MVKYLLDNNAISNFFSGMLPHKGMELMEHIIDEIPTISVITEIEALSWINTDKTKEQIIQSFIKDSNVLPIVKEVVAQCVMIRRSRKIKTPDAIIAATAIVYNLTLITSDADFENIKDLKLINPLMLYN
jgi:predicted nucleic acid-binding protein